MKSVFYALMMVLFLTPSARSQQSDAAAVIRFRQTAPLPSQATPPAGCRHPTNHILGSATVGGLAGWLVGIAAGRISGSSSTSQHNWRMRLLIGGSLIGAGSGAYRRATDGCEHPRRIGFWEI